MEIKTTYRLWLVWVFVCAGIKSYAQIGPKLITHHFFNFSSFETIEVHVLSEDSLILPGASAKFTLQLVNNSIDSATFTPDVIAPDGWTIIQSQRNLILLPQQQRTFTIIAIAGSFQTPGKHTFDLGIYVPKINQRFSVKDSVEVAERVQVVAYPLYYPKKVSSNSGSTMVDFAVENKGNTTEPAEVYLLGSDDRKKVILAPGKKEEFKFEFSPPRGITKGDVQVGVVVNLDRNSQQVTSIRNVEIYPSIIKKDISDNLSKINLRQGLAYTEQGYGGVFRTQSRIRAQLGQKPRNQISLNVSNLTVQSPTSLNQNTQFDLTKSFNTGSHSAKIGVGTFNPHTAFYFRLPRNFIGAKMDYGYREFKTEFTGLQKIDRSPADTVDQVLHHRATQKIGHLSLSNDFTSFTTNGLNRYLNESRANFMYKNYVKAALGAHLYDGTSIENLALEGTLGIDVRGTSLGIDLFHSDENFTPRNSNIDMGNLFINQRIGENALGLNASYFNQRVNANDYGSRYSVGGNLYLTVLPKLTLSTNASIFSSTNMYVGDLFESQMINYQGVLAKKFANNTQIEFMARNQVTDMKANGYISRQEASVGLRKEIRGIDLNANYRYEQSMGLMRNRGELTARYGIGPKLSLRSKFGYTHQPGMRISEFYTANASLSYRSKKSEVGLMVNSAFNNNAPNLLSVQTSGAIDLYIPRRLDMALKQLSGTIKDAAGNGVQNVLLLVGNESVITDKNGRFSVETIATDSLNIIVDRKSLPFGTKPANGYEQRVYTFDKKSDVTISLFASTRILGSINIKRKSGLKTLLPDYTKFMVILTQGDNRELRKLKTDGTFTASGLSPGVWTARLKSTDADYKAFIIGYGQETRELNDGEEWHVQFDLIENTQGVKIQSGIGR